MRLLTDQLFDFGRIWEISVNKLQQTTRLPPRKLQTTTRNICVMLNRCLHCNSTCVVSVHYVDADNLDLVPRHVGLGVDGNPFNRLHDVEPLVSACAVSEHTNKMGGNAAHALPKMVCLLSSQGVGTVVMKNCIMDKGERPNADETQDNVYLAAVRVRP